MLFNAAAATPGMRLLRRLLKVIVLALALFIFGTALHSSAQATEVDQDTLFEREVIRLVNEERERAGIAPLQANPDLALAAQTRALEASEQFSHTRPDGSPWRTVFHEYGFGSEYRGENLACSQTSPEMVVHGWMSSRTHRENILNAKYSDIAVAYEEVDGVPYWSQLFMKDEKVIPRAVTSQILAAHTLLQESQTPAPRYQRKDRQEARMSPVLLVKVGGNHRLSPVQAHWSLLDACEEADRPAQIGFISLAA